MDEPLSDEVIATAAHKVMMAHAEDLGEGSAPTMLPKELSDAFVRVLKGVIHGATRAECRKHYNEDIYPRLQGKAILGMNDAQIKKQLKRKK